MIPRADLIPDTWKEDGQPNQIRADYHMTMLTPYSSIEVQLCVKNNYFVGRPSDPIKFVTAEGGRFLRYSYSIYKIALLVGNNQLFPCTLVEWSVIFALFSNFSLICMYVYLTEPGPVQYFEVKESSSNSFSLYWIRPEQQDQHGIIVGYDIAYQTGEWFTALWDTTSRTRQVSGSRHCRIRHRVPDR